MKNVEFYEAFGLEEAAEVAGVSERNLLRMAGRGEISVWFKLWKGSEFFDQNDKVVELPKGWLRVTAREAKLFIEDEVVGITVFENQNGECFYPAEKTRPGGEVVGEVVGAVMVDDRCPHRYFGHSEAVPTAPTFKKCYFALGKDDLFFVPSEIEAIAATQKQEIKPTTSSSIDHSTSPSCPAVKWLHDKKYYQEAIAVFLQIFEGKLQRGGYTNKILNKEILKFRGQSVYEDDPGNRKINQIFSDAGKARRGDLQEFQRLQEEEQCYLLIIGEILNFLCNEIGNNMEIQGVNVIGVADILFSNHRLLEKKSVVKILIDIHTKFSSKEE